MVQSNFEKILHLKKRSIVCQYSPSITNKIITMVKMTMYNIKGEKDETDDSIR